MEKKQSEELRATLDTKLSEHQPPGIEEAVAALESVEIKDPQTGLEKIGTEGTSLGGSEKIVDQLVVFKSPPEAIEGTGFTLPEAIKIGEVVDDKDSSLRSDVEFTHDRMGMKEKDWEKVSPETQKRLKKIGRAAVHRMFKGQEAKMFRVQANTLPWLTVDPPRNVIAQAPGGGGKTVAFCMGILARVDSRVPHTQGLIIGMTRELARMIFTDALVPLGGYVSEDGQETDADVWEQGGGLAVQLKQPADVHGQPDSYLSMRVRLAGDKDDRRKYNDHIVVGTPGKLKGDLDRRLIDLSKLKVLVLDEADEIILGKDQSDTKAQVTNITKACPETCQVYFFSATFPEGAARLVRDVANNRLRLARLELKDLKSIMIPHRKQFSMHDQLFEQVAVVKGKFVGRRFILEEVIDGRVQIGNEIVLDGERTRRLIGKEGDCCFAISECCKVPVETCVVDNARAKLLQASGCKVGRQVRANAGRGKGRGGGRGGRGGRGDPNPNPNPEHCEHGTGTGEFKVVKGKVGMLRDIYESLQTNKSIVFCNDIDSCNLVEELMGELECKCSKLHSALSIEERDEAIDSFRGVSRDVRSMQNQSKVLVCTDLLARGVDIKGVTMVVNFDIPRNFRDRDHHFHPDQEGYAHRIARCARAGNPGVVINFIHSQMDRDFLREISQHWHGDLSMIREFKGMKLVDGSPVSDGADGLADWFEDFQKQLSSI